MGSSWSVFAVPASEVAKIPEAVKGLGLQDGKLFIGRSLAPVESGEPWVAFGIEHQGWRYIEPVSDEDLPQSFFAHFEQLVSLYGSSNTDSVFVTRYVRGSARLRQDTCYGISLLPLIDTLGFDVVRLGHYGGFGISPPELSGTEYPLSEPVPSLEAQSTFLPLPARLQIPESNEELSAAASEGPIQSARWGLAMVYRNIDSYEGIDLLDSVYPDLPKDTPEGKAVQALLGLVG